MLKPSKLLFASVLVFCYLLFPTEVQLFSFSQSSIIVVYFVFLYLCYPAYTNLNTMTIARYETKGDLCFDFIIKQGLFCLVYLIVLTAAGFFFLFLKPVAKYDRPRCDSVFPDSFDQSHFTRTRFAAPSDSVWNGSRFRISWILYRAFRLFKRLFRETGYRTDDQSVYYRVCLWGTVWKRHRCRICNCAFHHQHFGGVIQEKRHEGLRGF